MRLVQNWFISELLVLLDILVHDNAEVAFRKKLRFMISGGPSFFVKLGKEDVGTLIGIINKTPDMFDCSEGRNDRIAAEMSKRRAYVDRDEDDPMLEELSQRYSASLYCSQSILRHEIDPIIREQLLKISDDYLRKIIEENPAFVRIFSTTDSYYHGENLKFINKIIAYLNKRYNLKMAELTSSTFAGEKPFKNIEFNPEEFEDRSNWLFWSILDRAIESLGQLKTIFALNDADNKWLRSESKIVKQGSIFGSMTKWDVEYCNPALIQVLLYAYAKSVVIMSVEAFPEARVNEFMRRVITNLEIIFPIHKSNQMIDVFMNFLHVLNISEDEGQKGTQLPDNAEKYLIKILCELFKIKIENCNIREVSVALQKNFNLGKRLTVDAFAAVDIKQVQIDNLKSIKKQIDIFREVQKFRGLGDGFEKAFRRLNELLERAKMRDRKK